MLRFLWGAVVLIGSNLSLGAQPSKEFPRWPQQEESLFKEQSWTEAQHTDALKNLNQVVEYIQAGKTTEFEWKSGDRMMPAANLILTLRRTGDRRYAPLLKQIADDTTHVHLEILKEMAVLALWNLNEPREYFVEAVKKHKENPERARWCVKCLAFDPREREVHIIIDEARRCDTLAYFAWEARRTLYYAEKLADFQTTREKVVLAIAEGYFPADVDAGATMLKPPAVFWSRNQLYLLSKKDPEGAARALLTLDVPKEIDQWVAWRDEDGRVYETEAEKRQAEAKAQHFWPPQARFSSQFLCKESKAIFDKLDKEGKLWVRPKVPVK